VERADYAVPALFVEADGARERICVDAV